MEPKNNSAWNITHSWTQPYLPMSYNPFYERAPQPSTEEILAKLEMIDNWVDSMLTYPDAESIINRVMKQGERNV